MTDRFGARDGDGAGDCETDGDTTDGSGTGGDPDPLEAVSGEIGEPSGDASAEDLAENDGARFDRLPATPAAREVADRPTRGDVLAWLEGRYGIDPGTFEAFTFWEKGAGQVWVVAGDAPSPIAIEAMGTKALRTRQEHWKPTTEFVQRFGHEASTCVVELDRERAERFVAGESQDLEWDGDWGYLIAAHEFHGDLEPLGVGLYTYGELDSMVPKGRRREFRAVDG